jgi:transposase
MTDTPTDVIGGVDSHADTHHAAVIDQRGHPLGSSQFPATAEGYQQLAAWLRRHGRLDRVGVEGSGSYGAGLTRYLQACGICVVEVNRPHAHTAARRGKTDAITAALNQFDQLLVTTPAPVRESLTARGLAGKATQAAAWRPNREHLSDPAQSAKYALRSLAHRVRDLTAEAADLERRLAALVEQAAPRTLALLGVGPIHAAQMLITAGQNIDRSHGEAAFAHVCAADPIPASSGKTTRYRLNPFGDRDANRTPHMIAVVRLRYCDRTRAHVARRTAKGLSKKDIIRCLKRYIVREIYYALRADLKDLALPA